LSPGRPLYAIGAPLFQSVKLHLAGQKTFTIDAAGQSRANKYVKSLQLNHQPYEQLVIAHKQIMQGGTLEFVMSKSADGNWPEDRDPSALSETKTAAEISIINYKLSKNTVEPNEQFRIFFNLINKGSLGTQKIVVYANGKPLLFKNVLVPAGGTVQDSVSCRLYDPGNLTIGLSAQNGQRITVVEPLKPVISPYQVSGLKFSPMVKQHTAQKISYVLQNLTGHTQEFKIPLKINDLVLFTDTITLGPGKTKFTEHQFVAGQAGLYTLTVGNILVSLHHGSSPTGYQSAKYKVYSTDTSSLLLDLSLVKNNNDTLADRSGFENHAIINGKSGTTTTKGNQVLLGEDSFVEVPSAISLDQMGESLTMMCWVYPEKGNESGLVDMLSKGDHHVLQTNNNKTLTFFAGGWGRGDITIDLPANWMNQWHHLAGVCSGDMLYLYVDGKPSAAAKVDGLVNLSAESRWQIGRNEEFPSERVFHGYIDQVKVYGQALKQKEVLDIMSAEKKFLRSFIP
ncbi:MAG: LamG-like jellyroll fold domain-containing protein, partial [Pedobacter sp.]|uniref:LamG domain-containing protein n=1 Tax=Pedobacter sp. TaxID=1411316 RepID=UPI0033953F05